MKEAAPVLEINVKGCNPAPYAKYTQTKQGPERTRPVYRSLTENVHA